LAYFYFGNIENKKTTIIMRLSMVKKLLTSYLLFLIAAPLGLFAQGSLSGVVTDETTGETLIGAYVSVQEAERVVSTNANGRYEITNLAAGTYDVQVTYVGYKKFTTEVTVGNSNVTLDVELKPDYFGLEEVVVTGYGSSIDRANVTSSITKVGAEDLDVVTASNPNALLQGKAAGVNIVQNSGTPGGGIMVRVRGSTSISGSNDPLYVIDGVPVNDDSNAAIGVGNQGLNGLSTLNPNDIESIEVLKDASATAIYGARGANGVILVTTKSGSAGKTQINVGYTHGVKSFSNEIDMMDSGEFIEMYVDGVFADFLYDGSNWGDYNSRYTALQGFLGGFGLTPGSYTGISAIDTYGSDPSQAPTTDWQDEVFGTGITDEFTMSAQGGDVTTQYYMSGNYFNEDGIMENAGFQRLSGRLNLDHIINERMDISTRVNYSRSVTERLENDNNIYGVLTNALLSYPTAPAFNDDGTYNGSGLGAFSNPVAQTEVKNDAVRTRFVGNIDFNVDLLETLSATFRAGFDRQDLKEDQYAPSFTNQGSPAGDATSSVGIDETWLTEVQLNYNQDFDVHNINAVGVLSYQETNFERTVSTGTTFPVDELQTINSAATTTGGAFTTASGLESYLGRVNYGYDNRYLVTLTGRVDASSRFGGNEESGFFPSASVAWRLSNESFMEGMDVVNDLKLRLSYGITGNQPGGNFTHQGLYGGVSYTGVAGLRPTQFPNPDLKWEETTQMNAGVDLAILDERVVVTVDAYLKETDDLILARPVPASTGFTSFQSNIGSIENKGLELTLTTVNVQTKDFLWSSSLNIATNANEVTSLYLDQPFASGFANRVAVGQELGVFYAYESDGIWNTQDEIDEYVSSVQGEFAGLTAGQIVGAAVPGDVRFVDVNGDGILNSEDQDYVGSAQPDFTGGFTNTLKFKGFELNAFFQFSIGNDIYNNAQAFYGHYAYSYNSWAKGLDRWSPDNTDTNVPRASWFDDNQNTRDSDFMIYDGSYIRLKSLTLAYNFNAEQLEAIGLRSLRLFATGQNLFTIEDYPGLEVETNTFDGSNISLGTDFFSYPQARSIAFGVNIGL
jgi:TonB-linked SusC/RagA family outer membrane protein